MQLESFRKLRLGTSLRELFAVHATLVSSKYVALPYSVWWNGVSEHKHDWVTPVNNPVKNSLILAPTATEWNGHSFKIVLDHFRFKLFLNADGKKRRLCFDSLEVSWARVRTFLKRDVTNKTMFLFFSHWNVLSRTLLILFIKESMLPWTGRVHLSCLD